MKDVNGCAGIVKRTVSGRLSKTKVLGERS